MKLLRFSLPLLGLILTMGLFTACEDDDPIGPDLSVLQLDGPNVTGPIRPAGTHRFAVRFNETRLQPYDSLNLTGIRIFIGQAPARMELSAHVGGETVPAGVGERRLALSGSIQQGGFFDYTFLEPLTIDASQALWLVAEVELNEQQQSVGCDANGSGVPGGDFIFSPGAGWGTFQEETGDNINWNIRGLVE